MTAQYRVQLGIVGPRASRRRTFSVRSDDRVVVSSRPGGRLRTAIKVAPAGGYISLVNKSTRTISAALSGGRSVIRRTRIRPHTVVWFKTG
jgi:hypothetical protein